MHPIQAHILRELMQHERRAYSQLKPDGVEGNLFMYHFHKLLGLELVAKVEGGYVLTVEGKRHAARVSLRTGRTRVQPTICVFIACQDREGRWLLQRRAYHPFLGKKSFPYGKIKEGQTLDEAALHELHDKTGLDGDLEHRGEMYLRVYDEGRLLVHMLCHVFVGTNIYGTLKEENEKGACAWEAVEDGAPQEYLPGFKEMLGWVREGRAGWFGEVTIGEPAPLSEAEEVE